MWYKRLKIAVLHCYIKKEPFMRPGNLTASKAPFLRHEELLSTEGQAHCPVLLHWDLCADAPLRCVVWFLAGLAWGFDDRKRASLSSAYGPFLQPMEAFPRRSVLSRPNGIKKLQASSHPLCRCKSLVKCAWSQLQPCFSMKIYHSQASAHAMCSGDFGEHWPQWCVILILSSLNPLPGFPRL